jgi:large subunit ribosomal protein L29
MKSAEIKELSIADLREKIEDLQEQHNKLSLAHSVTHLENPVQLRVNRKVIARLKTELRGREIAESLTQAVEA